MADDADRIANAERPVVQESQFEGHVELYFPERNETVILSERYAGAVAGDILRILTGTDPDDVPDEFQL